MKFPTWAPPELLEKYKELKPKADAEEQRRREFFRENHPEVDWKTHLEKDDDLYTGLLFIGDAAQFRILNALITNPLMEDVWRGINRRSPDFQYNVRTLYGGNTPALSLYGTCVQTEMNWLNTPKITRSESIKLHEEIAVTALRLCELLIQAPESRDMLDTRKYLDKEKYKAFMKALERDGHELWYGIDGYLDHLLGEALPIVPKILHELHKRALKHAKHPRTVSQPNAASAKLNFFIHELFKYFNESYGQPLNAYTAAIVSSMFNEEIEEDRVRALLRARRTAARKRSRKKVEEAR